MNTALIDGAAQSPGATIEAPAKTRTASALMGNAGGSRPTRVPGSGGDDDGLTKSKLYRFGAIIIGAILVVLAAAEWGAFSQGSALDSRNQMAETRDFVLQADMLHDAIRATVFGSALALQAGREQVDALQTELAESVPQFTDNINSAIALNADAQIVTQLRAIVPEVAAYGQTSEALTGAWADLTSADPAVKAAATTKYQAWVATFESLKNRMADVEAAIDVKSAAVVRDASDTRATHRNWSCSWARSSRWRSLPSCPARCWPPLAR